MSCMIFCLLFGVIGFIDDFAKVAKKQNEGLKPMQKIVLQVVAAVLWLAAMYWDRAVWMEPAQTAKAILNSGWIIL